MPGPDKSAFTETNLGSSGPRDRAAEVYDRHAVAVYRQALLMLADEDMAGQVACDVITGECARAAAAPGDQDSASRRLAMSVLRRCQELLDSRARQDRAGRRRPARRDAGRHSLRGSERALLGLVLFGGLGYREAARALAIRPSRAAAVVRAALSRAASSPAHRPDAAAGTCDRQ